MTLSTKSPVRNLLHHPWNTFWNIIVTTMTKYFRKITPYLKQKLIFRSRQNSGCLCLGVLCMHARIQCPNLRYVHERTKPVCMHVNLYYAYPDIRLDLIIHFAFMPVVICLKYLVTSPEKLKMEWGSNLPLAR